MHKGAVSEAKAIAWLLQEGYFVFQSCTVTGPVDLIAWKADGETKLVDVKTCERSNDKRNGGAYGFHKLSPTQVAAGIVPLYVSVADNIIGWDASAFPEPIKKAP